jgi:hypothetical protein
VYVHTFMHIHTYLLWNFAKRIVQGEENIYINTHAHMCVHACIQTDIYSTYTRVCIYIYIHIHIYIYIYIYIPEAASTVSQTIYTYIYTHPYIHTFDYNGKNAVMTERIIFITHLKP